MEHALQSSNGNTIHVRVASPGTGAPFPTLVGVPGGIGAIAFGYLPALSAALIDNGIQLVNCAPQGREGSEGQENCNGHIHQGDLKAVIEYLLTLTSVDHSRLAIASFSYGITVTFGALARYPELPVLFVIDWEGPACGGRDFHRAYVNGEEWVQRFLDINGDGVIGEQELESFRAPWACNVAVTDEAYWAERDAARYASDIGVPYLRYQADVDHVQGTSKYHMMELVNAATAGRSPWTRVNDNPPNTIYREEDLARYHFHAFEGPAWPIGDETAQILASYVLELFKGQPWEGSQR